ncbi:MAG: helix-turn-helix domain-containing protein [Deltaproteobacteria bacterium]|nr:helix-turn-helix domain-containing protein [Deltaproteobacteria bacterium]MBW2046961.1 helix-turn-helix domain-containing protein [Deltaproteobacteria bacterium]
MIFRVFMGREKDNPSDEELKDWEFPSGRELGAILRNKREEMGLSHAQISERIKLRPHFLQALENEDWDSLPSPAFVKGFIRSYARALGLAEDGLIALYQEITPQPHEVPVPAGAQEGRGKKRLAFYIILLVACCVAAYAVFTWWRGLSPTEKGTVEHREQVQAPEGPAEPKAVQSVPKEDRGIPVSESEPAQVLPEAENPALTEAPPSVPELVPQGEASAPEQAEEPPVVEEEEVSTEQASSPASEPDLSEASPPPATEKKALVLKALVKERTWVRVRADNEKPKEYILAPNSRHRWQADRGFDLLIGNAGGIELELNGKKMPPLGKQGQVVRLKLPMESERSSSEN